MGAVEQETNYVGILNIAFRLQDRGTTSIQKKRFRILYFRQIMDEVHMQCHCKKKLLKRSAVAFFKSVDISTDSLFFSHVMAFLISKRHAHLKHRDRSAVRRSRTNDIVSNTRYV
jgi:hypothetical protein